MVSFSNEWVVVLVSFTLFIIFLFKWYSNSASEAGKRMPPPSPPRLPVIGNLHQLGLHAHRSLQALSKRYGPVMMIHLGSIPTLIVSSAEAVQEIAKKQDVAFSNRPKLKVMDAVAYDSKDIAFSPYGEYWRHVRSICVLQLLSHKRVQSFRRVREEETSLMIAEIKSLSSSSSRVNLSNPLVSLTNGTISRVAFGRKYGDGEHSLNFDLMVKEISELLVTFNPGDYIPWLKWVSCINGFDARLQKVAKSFDEFLSHVVEEHRSKNQRKEDLDGFDGKADLADILLKLQRENTSNSPLEMEAIKAVIFDMFAAGTDTTFTALEWTISELIRHPKIIEKLQKEVRRVGENKLEISEEDLDKMPYLKAVIKESLRLHPPFPLLLPREVAQNTKLMGYDIGAGTRVMINAWAIGRDPMLWENANEFYPGRFLNSRIDFKGLDFELIPFGFGRRGCPGITFAMVVAELALAKLMLEFNFVAEKDLDMTEAIGTMVCRKTPLIVTLSRVPTSNY